MTVLVNIGDALRADTAAALAAIPSRPWYERHASGALTLTDYGLRRWRMLDDAAPWARVSAVDHESGTITIEPIEQEHQR